MRGHHTVRSAVVRHKRMDCMHLVRAIHALVGRRPEDARPSDPNGQDGTTDER
jgi:hypothetical protein